MSDEIEGQAAMGVRDVSIDKIASVMEEGLCGSDRVCAILSVAMVENALEELLRAKCKSASGASDEECDSILKNWNTGALASTGERRQVAVMFGLVGRKVSCAIGVAAKIRNRFAHHEFPAHLGIDDANNIRVQLPEAWQGVADVTEGTFLKAKPDESIARARFAAACSAVLMHLMYLTDKIKTEKSET